MSASDGPHGPSPHGGPPCRDFAVRCQEEVREGSERAWFAAATGSKSLGSVSIYQNAQHERRRRIEAGQSIGRSAAWGVDACISMVKIADNSARRSMIRVHKTCQSPLDMTRDMTRDMTLDMTRDMTRDISDATEAE